MEILFLITLVSISRVILQKIQTFSENFHVTNFQLPDGP